MAIAFRAERSFCRRAPVPYRVAGRRLDVTAWRAENLGLGEASLERVYSGAL